MKKQMRDKRTTLGGKIADYRMKKGITQKELSLRLGLSESYIGQIERGIGKTGSLNKIQDIADFFGVSIDSLAEDDLIVFKNIKDTDEECVRYFSILSEEKQNFIIEICEILAQ
uniref:HTH cro/C1-type domain-containing protein n=1 Tax=uncultured Bacillota bacterium TaxID=344338 RepID=A0A650EQH6_9FIRM|nr:hypothetical protein Firmicute1046_2800 [uncultured Firmicutes bacterium]